ncbi:cytochrome P450 2C19-like isoform X1, partial [Dinothrombium tinctorium]
MGKSDFESKIHEVCDLLISNVDKRNGQVFDMHLLLSNFSSNIISMMLFSKMFEYNDPLYIELRAQSTNFFRACNHLNGILYGNVFRLYLMIERKSYALIKKMNREFLEFGMKILNERICHKDSGAEDDCDDLFDCYLKRMEHDKNLFD